MPRSSCKISRICGMEQYIRTLLAWSVGGKQIFGPPDIFSVGYFKKINAFLVCTMCCHETIHDKWTGVKIKAWLGS